MSSKKKSAKKEPSSQPNAVEAAATTTKSKKSKKKKDDDAASSAHSSSSGSSSSSELSIATHPSGNPSLATSNVFSVVVPTVEEQEERWRSQRELAYAQLVKFEQVHNATGMTSACNAMQEPEMREIALLADAYVAMSLESVARRDKKVFHVSPKLMLQQQQLIMTPSVESPSQTTIASTETVKSSVVLPVISPVSDELNPVLTIDSVIATDLLRNGLRGCPFMPQKDAVQLTEPFLDTGPMPPPPSEDKIETQSKRSKKSVAASVKSQSVATKSSSNMMKELVRPSVLTLKYMLALELDAAHFELTRSNRKEQTHEVRLVRRPKAWSCNDLELLTHRVDTRLNNKMARVCEQSSLMPIDAKVRLLNSKGLLDRLVKPFSVTLRKRWSKLLQQALQVQKQQQASSQFSSSRATNTATAVSSPSSEDAEKLPMSCEVRNNQLRIEFKWQGAKMKDFDVVILVDIGIKYTDPVISHRNMDTCRTLYNKFIQNGGISPLIPTAPSSTTSPASFSSSGRSSNHRQPPVIHDAAHWQRLVDWCERHLRLNMTQCFLVPQCAQQWQLSTHALKTHLLKFLVWLNGLAPQHLEQVVRLLETGGPEDELAANVSKLFFAQAPPLTKQTSAQLQRLIQTQLLLNATSTLNLLVKTVQIANHLSFGLQQLLHQQAQQSVSTITPPSQQPQQVKFLDKPTVITEDKVKAAEPEDPDLIATALSDDVEDELLVDIVLGEIQRDDYSFMHVDEAASAVEPHFWHTLSLFERVWSCMQRTRQAMLDGYLRDPFQNVYNALPDFWIKYGEFKTWTPIAYAVCPCKHSNNKQQHHHRSMVPPRSKLPPVYLFEKPPPKRGPHRIEKLNASIEQTMKLLCTSVLTDDSNIYHFPQPQAQAHAIDDVNFLTLLKYQQQQRAKKGGGDGVQHQSLLEKVVELPELSNSHLIKSSYMPHQQATTVDLS